MLSCIYNPCSLVAQPSLDGRVCSHAADLLGSMLLKPYWLYTFIHYAHMQAYELTKNVASFSNIANSTLG